MEIHKKDCQAECRNKQQKGKGWSVYAIEQNRLSVPAISHAHKYSALNILDKAQVGLKIKEFLILFFIICLLCFPSLERFKAYQYCAAANKF
jgi:hypothetical protein